MFAVLKTGGKQYRVRPGDVLRVEKLAADAGETIQFNDVLMVGDTVGSPFVAGAGVQAQVIDQIKGEKLIHFVKRRRKHGSKRTKGHRQQLTLLRIGDVLQSGAEASGVKAAVGAGSVSGAKRVVSDGRYAMNRTDQAEMIKRTVVGEADAKVAERTAVADTETGAGAPGNLLTEARGGTPDDLKLLSGVGPKLEKLLHTNGVFHFDQIAEWTAEEVAAMDDRLSFKGRIARDDWQGQARTHAATEKE